jgi:nucleoid-associated protein YgaU
MPTSISMEVFFDAFEELAGDVSHDVETLLVWTRPTPVSIARGLAQPPLLRFIWGANPVLQGFQGYLKSVTARYTLFRSDGTPIRATASISLEEVTPEAASQNPTSGSLEGRRSYVVAEGDTLHSIAFREFARAALWRGLANFNQVDDPLRLSAGTALLIPTRGEAERLSETEA